MIDYPSSPVFQYITVSQDVDEFTVKHVPHGADTHTFRTIKLKENKTVGSIVGIIEFENRVYEIYRGEFGGVRSEVGRPIMDYT